jgi:PAS domain S-box-containing protein
MNLYVTAAALLVACLALLIYDQVTFRQRLVLGIGAQAEMIGSNSASAITFNDPDAAVTTLSALKHSPTFLAAAIYTPDGKKFAEFSTKKEKINAPPPIASGQVEGHWFSNNRLLSAHVVEFQGKTLGTVYVLASLDLLRNRLIQFLQITLGVLVLSLIAALVISAAFRRRLIDPISRLAATATSVSRDKNYSVRAPNIEGRDELALLIQSFNEMLSHIQARDLDLQNERARLATVVNNAPVGILLAEAPSGRIIFGNRRAEEILQLSIGKLADLASADQWLAYHPDGRRLSKPEIPLFRAVMKGDIVHGEEQVFDRRDGTTVWLRSSAAPIRSRNGNIVGGVVAFNDIDEEKRADQMLRQAYDRLAIAQSTANMADWEWDLKNDQITLSSDAERLHGFASEQFDDRFETLSRAVIETDRQKFIDAMRQAAGSGHTLEIDYRVLREDGSVRWLLSKAIIRRDGDGTIASMLGVTMDISTLRLAQEALLQSEKLAAAGRLAASISHEINNPLESVTNLLFLIAGDKGMSPATRRFVQQAEDELARVSHIATQTLRFYRQSTKPTSADLGSLLDSVLALHRGRFANMRITIVRQYRTNMPLLCFEGELRQVFTNLVGNALDAMAGEGTLMLRTALSKDWKTGKPGIRVSVADTGPGISAATLSRIFEPFFSTKGNRGTGLGLWVSREIVLKHKGDIKARSRSGKGTVFSILFPLDGIVAEPRRDSAAVS